MIDQAGILHLVDQSDGGTSTNYRKRLPDGTWTEPINFLNYGGRASSIALGSDGTIHLLWSDEPGSDTLVHYQFINPQGAWSPPELIASSEDWISNIDLVIGSDGRLHALMADQYAFRSADGTWSPAFTMSIPYADGALAADRDGRGHLAGSDSTITYYQTREPDGTWSSPVILDQNLLPNPYSFSVLTDPGDTPHIMFCEGYDLSCYYLSEPLVSQAANVSISQLVGIPSNMHKPTLSFFYQLKSVPLGTETGLEVLVSDSVTTTQVFSVTSGSDCAHAWVGMDDWAGETITVTLKLKQATGNPQAYLALDDISLGSWLTPLMYSVSPVQLESFAAQTIEVQGANFLPTPAIRLGGQVIGSGDHRCDLDG